MALQGEKDRIQTLSTIWSAELLCWPDVSWFDFYKVGKFLVKSAWTEMYLRDAHIFRNFCAYWRKLSRCCSLFTGWSSEPPSASPTRMYRNCFTSRDVILGHRPCWSTAVHSTPFFFSYKLGNSFGKVLGVHSSFPQQDWYYISPKRLWIYLTEWHLLYKYF